MLDVQENNFIDKIIIKLFNTRILIIFGALIVPFLVINSNTISINLDPLIFYLLNSIGFLAGIFIFNKAKSNPVMPYIALQMILFFIFLDKKILSHLSLNLKLYGVIFIISLFIAAYYLIKNFNYLWNNSSLFKYLFIYFSLTGLYLLFHYHSDFRLSNDFLVLTYAQSLKVGGLGDSQTSREFGDLAQYVLFIEWLIPIVSVTISLMLFKGLKTTEEINNRLIKTIKYFSLILVSNFVLAGIAYVLGFNSSFVNIGSKNNPGLNFIFPLFLFFMLGFSYYLSNLKSDVNTKTLSKVINMTIIYLVIAIIFSMGSSAMTLALLMGLPIIFLLISKLKLDLPFVFSSKKIEANSTLDKINNLKKDSAAQLFKAISLISVLSVVILYLANQMAIAHNNDVSSFAMRLDHWKGAYESWIRGLDLFKFLFGYGLDTIRETIYFASNSSAIEKGIVSAHNIFISMIYEQGLVSFFYFAAIISTAMTSLKYIQDKTIDINAKIFSIINIAIVSTVFAMGIFVDMTLIFKIIFFCMLGFIESIKITYNKNRIYRRNRP